MWTTMKAKTLQAMMVTASLVAAPVLAKGKPAATPPSAQPPAADAKPTVAPQKFVESLYERLNGLSKASPTLDVLHEKIGAELKGIIDYTEMARLALGTKWTEINDLQRKEFIEYLTRMVQNTYVKRFKPGQAVDIRYGAAPKALPDDRVQVATTITVGKTSAEVNYALRPAQGRWWVYDIVVDDASQVQTYRQSFKKILDKEGWPGLIARMKKAAEKKV